jgi:glycosyltransferase involved in cell wall biosynthesis
MKKWEKTSWGKAAAIIAVSQEDKKKIGRAHVVPNGVDLETFPFRPKKIYPKNPVFLYVGNFRWMENKDAARNIYENYWPIIQKQYPDARLRIVGQEAPDGPIASMTDEFSRADVLLAPIRVGGGTKFKILEAMASGVPIITTTVGAQGLPNDCFWIADTPDAMKIDQLLNDTKKIHKAREIVEKQYNWDSIAQNLDAIWNSLS